MQVYQGPNLEVIPTVRLADLYYKAYISYIRDFEQLKKIATAVPGSNRARTLEQSDNKLNTLSRGAKKLV